MLRLIRTIAEMRAQRRSLPGSLGFVPTMGYLHEGHLALVRRARAENEAVVVSIYVNPTQFGPRGDFDRYPRDIERDLGLLKQEKVPLVFAPSDQEMYPPDFCTWVEVGGLADKLEGAARPGHFRGVATVVAKLFHIVEPTRAYFGEKDAQQVMVLQRMVVDLNMNLEVVAVPTVREPDGLALSSRNVYLSPPERQAALVLSRSLALAQQLWSRGERDAERLRQEMRALIEKEPLARIDYISIAHPQSLEEWERIAGRALVSLAVKIGQTRLIDNVTL